MPPEAMAGALHGDTVLVGSLVEAARGLEGRVEEVTRRRSPRVAGVLRRRGRAWTLELDDTRLRGPVLLGGRLSVGRDGEAAVATITRFPSAADELPEGELLAVLGAPGDPNVEVAKILLREEITELHPQAALDEAERMASRLRRVSLEGRVDLRQVPLPTIDPEDARDHDDSVWVERRGQGYRAWIAIADVSEYVQAASALDEEAARRGCTLYLPDRAVPMLPGSLAADLCSLLPEQDRLCLCVIVDLDASARVQRYEVVEGVMRSAAMLTYGGVARTLGFTQAPPRSAQAEALKPGLMVLDELTRKLHHARIKRGALELDLPEPKLELDPKTGAAVSITRRAQDPGIKQAYRLIEELMLLANELVADWLGRRQSPAIYRVHGAPDPKKLERFAALAELLGVTFDLSDVQLPGGIGRFLKSLQDHPRQQVLEMLLLRSLKQAHYDLHNVGHYGLASPAYLHFTSPIRRYPDLLVHRQVKHLLRGGKVDRRPEALSALGALATRSSERERHAMDVEREIVDLYRALYMREHLGELMSGSVTALVGSGAFVSLDEPFCDVLIRFEAMGPDQYELDEHELAYVGVRSGDTLALGDRVSVIIEDVAVLRRQVYARRVAPEAAQRTTARPRREGKPARRGVADPGRSAPAGRESSSKAGKPAPRQGRGAAQRGAKRSRPPR